MSMSVLRHSVGVIGRLNFWLISRERYYVSYLRKELESLDGKLRQYAQWCFDNCKCTKVSTRLYPLSSFEVALIPLYVCVAAGAVGAVYYMARLATRNPDVTWNRSANPEPWQEYRDKQYKFYSPIRDYSKSKSPAPKYDE